MWVNYLVEENTVYLYCGVQSEEMGEWGSDSIEKRSISPYLLKLLYMVSRSCFICLPGGLAAT